MTVDAGRRVFGGRYEAKRSVGSGGMAEVFLAYDQLLDRDVAVKALNEELAREPRFIERFRLEARTAARLSHPNIVALHDYGATDDSYFIVMEWRPKARSTPCASPASLQTSAPRSSGHMEPGSSIATSLPATS